MEEILASIRRIIADDQDGARPAANMPTPEPADEDDDVLDLAELSRPAPSARLELEHEDVSFRDDDGQIDFDAIPVDEEEEHAPSYSPEPASKRVPQPTPPVQGQSKGQDTLLSSAANATVSSAFNLLGSTVLSNNARTLEDLVKEMLRPMLKGWLDENLPPMVERLVRAEIERVSRGGR